MCRKRKYDTELEAMIKLSSIQQRRNEHNRPKTEQRAYQCTVIKCGGTWHLTSQKENNENNN